MQLLQLFIQNDAAHDTLHELGEVGCLQFKDMNSEKSAFQRLFVQVRASFESIDEHILALEEETARAGPLCGHWRAFPSSCCPQAP